MARPPPNLLILGEGAVAAALKAILSVPVMPRRCDDSGWDWPKGGIADRSKLILVASPHSGAGRIVRHHAELWTAPGASRIGVVMVVPEQSVAKGLSARDVFGRRQATGSTFSDYSNAICIVRHPITLSGVIAAVTEVSPLLKDFWVRQARNASCIPLLLDAIRQKCAADLERVIPLAKNVHWDSICHPTQAFPNHHAYANAIGRWLGSVKPGFTPDWKTGFDLIEPLANR
ncbi:MAG TPA: hypothetical protein PLU30_00295 [Verrucomicrobiae bacterium]|nr:hypothetical protein [Verrucomicrobiae bacterium]